MEHLDRDEEKAAVERAKAGDESAFEALVTAHERLVYTLAYQRLGSVQDAQDAAQETFVKAWLSLSGFRGESRFSVWLCRIANNVCTDMQRKRTPPSVSLDDAGTQGGEGELAADDERYSPQAALEKKELWQALRRGIDMLPDDYRQALTLRELGGLSYDEIADTLGVDMSAVKSRLYRARKKLCEFLAESGNISAGSPSKKAKGGAGR